MAETKPSHTELKQIEKALSEEKNHLKDLDKKSAEIKKELHLFRHRLILMNQDIVQKEKNLTFLNQKLEELGAQQAKLEAEIKKLKTTSKEMVSVLQNLGINPPEQTLVKPQELAGKIHSSILINKTLPQIQANIQKIHDKSKELSEIEAEMQDQKSKLDAQKKEVKQKYTQLSSLLDDRNVIFDKTKEENLAHQKRLVELSKKAENLKDLLKSLEEQKPRNKPQKNQKSREPIPVDDPKFDYALLKDFQPPIYGEVISNFGDLNTAGLKQQGISFKTEPGATITAPSKGKVLFIGPFRNYGNIVIIKHDKNIHSLIAGFKEFDTFIGHDVIAMEPIGKADSKAQDKAVIYFELRYNGNTVDPALLVNKTPKK